MLDQLDKRTGDASINADIAALRDDISALKSDFKTLFRDGVGVAKQSAEKRLQKGEELLDTAKTEVAKSRDTVEGKIRENPLMACGVALGTGFLLAALRRK